MNINGYALIIMDILDTILRGVKCWLSSSLLAVGYLLHATGEYYILLML